MGPGVALPLVLADGDAGMPSGLPSPYTAAVTSSPSTAKRDGHRANGLNLLRLGLAGLVLIDHGMIVSGGPEASFLGNGFGYWGVAGFFCISGYLVTRSATRLKPLVYYRHRLGRLMPAYWVCLLITALLLAPVAARSLAFLPDSFRYFGVNAALVTVQFDIAGTPSWGHYPHVWNASLWTLSHEFLCYVVVGFLALAPFFGGKRSVFGWGAAWLAATALQVAVLRYAPGLPFEVRGFIRLLPLFLGGALVQARWSQTTLRPAIGAIALGLALVIAWIEPGYGLQVSAPLLAYALMSLGTALPSPSWIQRNDISYGTYLYAFPITQLLAAYWIPTQSQAAGLGAWFAIITVGTVGLAGFSWFAVERPALDWARRTKASRIRAVS